MLLKKKKIFSPKQKRHQIASSEEKRENKRQRSYRQLKVENKWKIGCASQLPVAYFKVFSESLFFLQHRLLLLLFNELKLPQLQCNSSQSQTVKRRKGSDLLVLHYHQHHPQHSTPLPAEIPTTTLSFLLSPHPPPPPSQLSPLHPPPPPPASSPGRWILQYRLQDPGLFGALLYAEQHGSGGGTLEAAVKRRLLLLLL